jgi:transposase-like protein
MRAASLSSPMVRERRLGPGHPTLYDEDLHPAWAEGMRRSGYTAKEVAEAMGVAESTLWEWAKEHQSFSNAIREGSVESCGRVARALYRRALGGATVEEHTETADGGFRVSRRELPPDVTAQRFFLMNRDRQRWTERREHAGDAANPIGVVVLPAKQGAPS